MKKYVILIVSVACIAIMIQQLLAQQETDPKTALAPTEANGTVGAEEETCKGCVTLDFEDADIRNVLEILSFKAGVNIVPSPDVQGLVTIKLKNVTWQDALNVILKSYGYGYNQQGNVIIVTNVANLKKLREDDLALADQESVTTKTYVLAYANASEIVGSIEKMLTSRGTINFDKRANVLIVRDTPSNLQVISSVVENLDTATPQVLIEAKIIETTLGNTEKMGINWTAQAKVTGGKMPTFFPFTPTSSNKYIKDITWPSTDDATVDNTMFTYGTLDFSQVQAVLDLLKSRTGTDILSNPRIATLDNQKANIVVGTQYPLPQYTYNEQTGNMQVSGWDYKDIGIIFEVTPQVNRLGYVTLKVEPKVSSIIEGATASVEGTTLPVLSVSSASTRIMIKNGQTLIIAGLIKSTWSDSRKKVPFLGDIPIVGALFKHSSKVLEKKEMFIFITPHIIESEKDDSSAELKDVMDRVENRKQK
jgi:type IV pilus assembly protein PilQ